MIARFFWSYLCLTGIASIVVYCACLAAARADRIRRSAVIKKIKMLNKSAEMANTHHQHPAQLIHHFVIER